MQALWNMWDGPVYRYTTLSLSALVIFYAFLAYILYLSNSYQLGVIILGELVRIYQLYVHM